MKIFWQIGISRINGEHIDWQHDYVEAETMGEAEELACKKGYYKNVRVRRAE